MTSEECINALASPISDYEDAVLEKVAEKSKMDYIVTRNIKDYKNGNVKVILPDEFIESMTEDE